MYSGKGKTWQRNVIDDSLLEGHTILTADLDGDGRDEIVAGYRGKGHSVNIYRNTGNAWKRETPDNGGIAAASCAAGDLNGDKRIDIVCIGAAATNLKWYENTK